MKHPYTRPRAITMWDFSWLERRWPGAGYEDWGRAIDELVERGYDSIRIDAYPHLVSAGAYRQWELLPGWTQTAWGAQSPITVTVMPDLIDFLSAARDRNVLVALSSWYRQDSEEHRLRIRTPEKQAQIWIDTLGHIDRAGLLDTILYVDLCNEFPGNPWSPYMYDDHTTDPMASRTEPRVAHWMNESIRLVRAAFPDLEYTYSFSNEYTNWAHQDLSEFDLLEPHIWMSHHETSDFHAQVGYHFERYDPIGFDNITKNARREYVSKQDHYDSLLTAKIHQVADWSRSTGLGVITTECWGMVDYKDWPGLDWGWVKDLTEFGLREAAGTGRWLAMATSNFCGPQFVGMWRDVDWHQRLTRLIRSAPIDADVHTARDQRHDLLANA